jgi:hypothetical protein
MQYFVKSTAFVAIVFIGIFIIYIDRLAADAGAATTLPKLAGLARRSMSARKVRVQCALCVKTFFVFLESIT